MLRSSRSTGDIPSQFHAASLMDDAGYARRVNPLEPGILASPCKRRPDTGRPCPLAGKDKGNALCAACRLMYGGRGPDEAAARAFAAGRPKPGNAATRTRVRGRFPFDLPPRGAVCAMPGCDRPPAGRKSPFCATCKSRVVSRARRWYAARPGASKPPLAYLLAIKRPVRQPVGW